tara:strand:- start:642 stop:1745 length:1104 start_codon:yes stop_codon:yes gene_type:complete
LTGKPNYPNGKLYDGYSFLNKRQDNYQGINVYRSNLIPRGSASGLRLLINYISFVIFAIFRILSIRGKFDRVFVYAPSPITVGYIGIFASFYFKAKPFLWVHDLWPESVKAAGGINNKIILSLINTMTKSIYYFYDNILVQSPYFKNYLVNQGVNSEKITYYPYYAESFYKIVDKNKKIDNLFPKGLNIIFAGNIGVAQSFDTIIEAVKITLNNFKNLNIIVLGDGRDKTRVLKKIKEEGLNNFYFMGSFPPEDMPEYFASADALLVSLKKSKIFSSTIPGKIQSYLACGKPIIASLDGIGAKIVNDASCGFSSKAEDSQGLAESIIAFNKLKEEDKIRLGINARKYYENEFEREKLLSKLIDIFEK